MGKKTVPAVWNNHPMFILHNRITKTYRHGQNDRPDGPKGFEKLARYRTPLELDGVRISGRNVSPMSPTKQKTYEDSHSPIFPV